MFEATAHDTILVIVQVTAVLFLAYLFRAAYQARAARQHEMAKQILDKISSEEFLDLLKTDEGRRSIERLIGDHKSPEEWVTTAVRRSIFLLSAGVAGVIAFLVTDFSGHEIPLMLGSLSIAVGVGYLVAAALTRGRARRETNGPAA